MKSCARGCWSWRGRSHDTAPAAAYIAGARGEQVNHKRVNRVYREAGTDGAAEESGKALRARGSTAVARTAANQEWALDFVHDAVECGRTIRVLSVVDEYTRECLALEVDTEFREPTGDAGAGGDHRGARKGRRRSVATTGRNSPAGIFWHGASNGRSSWCIFSRESRRRTGDWKAFNGKLRDECLTGELVSESVRGAAEDRRLANRLQRTTAAQ